MISTARQCGRIPRLPGRRGLTLVELVVSIAITTVIMLGVGSAMIIAGRAVPGADNPVTASIAAAQVTERLATELQYAVAVNARSAIMIEFTVADRDADDVVETIRYEWSGTPGDPLTRQYNEGAVVNVLETVQYFSLSYDLEVVTESLEPESTSAETLLISYDSTLSLVDYAISSSDRYAQYFYPSLPADTVSWSVTRVEFFAKIHGGTAGECAVQLQLPTTAQFPSGIVLGERRLLESTLLETYLKRQFTFSGVSGLSPDKGLCLVFKWIADTHACDIRGCTGGAGTPKSRVVESKNGGLSWSTMASDTMLYWVYGTVTTAQEPEILSTYFLRGVDIVLRTGNDNQSEVRTRIGILNTPEVMS